MKVENSDVLIAFGNKIRELRIERKLSQEQLADLAGLHRTYIGMIERAEKNITLINIYKLSKALNVDMEEIFRNAHN
ncbi:helix-turn-helix domain-containing protein [Sphingobacterium spiritivorum]|uniref:helix-turn-helix domain-containing protein n=1 Tax=Sphingobacterium spiritivorum TaxID=258 RepID=UPI003DA5D2E5